MAEQKIFYDQVDRTLAEITNESQSESEELTDLMTMLTGLATDLEDADGPPSAAQKQVYAEALKKWAELKPTVTKPQ